MILKLFKTEFPKLYDEITSSQMQETVNFYINRFFIAKLARGHNKMFRELLPNFLNLLSKLDRKQIIDLILESILMVGVYNNNPDAPVSKLIHQIFVKMKHLEEFVVLEFYFNIKSDDDVFIIKHYKELLLDFQQKPTKINFPSVTNLQFRLQKNRNNKLSEKELISIAKFNENFLNFQSNNVCFTRVHQYKNVLQRLIKALLYEFAKLNFFGIDTRQTAKDDLFKQP